MMNNKSMTATLRFAMVSDKKMQLIAKLVRGKEVNHAMNILKFAPNKAAKMLLKVVKSAYANATNNDKADPSSLFVETVDLGKAPRIKRMRFVGRGRAHPYEKYRTFVRVVLNTK